MTRWAGKKKNQSTFKLDFSAENMSRCEGFYPFIVHKRGVPYEVLVRCQDPHPHQVAVATDEDGHAREVPLYSFINELLTEGELQRREHQEQSRLERGDVQRERSEAQRERSGFERVVPFETDKKPEDFIQSAMQEVMTDCVDVCPDCSKGSNACVCDIPF